MKIKKEHQQIAIGAAVGLAVMYFITFMALYQEQPKTHSCLRAAAVCNFQGAIDTTPYAECDSCCPDEPPEDTIPNDCDGAMIPTTDQQDYADAYDFCSQYTSCQSDIVQKQCLPIYGDFGLWTTCACTVALI